MRARPLKLLAPLLIVGLVACAPSRRVDPASIDLPAAEQLSRPEILGILLAMSDYHRTGYSILEERTGADSAVALARGSLEAEARRAPRLAELGVADLRHHLARSIGDREAGLSASLPPRSDAAATAAFLQQLADQERWFVVLIDNALRPSATGRLRAYLESAREDAVGNMQRLRQRGARA